MYPCLPLHQQTVEAALTADGLVAADCLVTANGLIAGNGGITVGGRAIGGGRVGHQVTVEGQGTGDHDAATEIRVTGDYEMVEGGGIRYGQVAKGSQVALEVLDIEVDDARFPTQLVDAVIQGLLLGALPG